MDTVVKLVLSLTSPKACIKYLCVALCLYLSWAYLEPYLEIPSIAIDQRNLILFLIGVGGGVLVGTFLCFSFDKLYGFFLTKKIEVESEKSKELFVQKFKAAFVHLTLKQKETLRLLTKGDFAVNVYKDGNASLLKNKYVKTILNIDQDMYLVRINPLVKSYVQREWDEELDSKIDNFLSLPDNEGVKLLEVMKEGGDLCEIDRSLLLGLSAYTGIIRGEAQDDGFWMWFDDGAMLDKLSERLGVDLLGELFIHEDRLV